MTCCIWPSGSYTHCLSLPPPSSPFRTLALPFSLPPSLSSHPLSHSLSPCLVASPPVSSPLPSLSLHLTLSPLSLPHHSSLPIFVKLNQTLRTTVDHNKAAIAAICHPTQEEYAYMLWSSYNLCLILVATSRSHSLRSHDLGKNYEWVVG